MGLAHTATEGTVGVIQRNCRKHVFGDTKGAICGKEIGERPGAQDYLERFRKRSIVGYHSAGSVVNRKVFVLSALTALIAHCRSV